MIKSKIKEKEKMFKKTLKSGKRRFQVIKDVNNEKDQLFTKLKADNDSYYYKYGKTKKTKICIHFTVGYIDSDINVLTKKDNKVSVQYLIDSSGNIYNLFNDEYWSYHLGPKCIGGNKKMSMSTIGIELCNYGPLTKKNNKFYDVYGNLFTKDENDVLACEYRGQKYFCKLDNEQKDALVKLLKYLTKKHNIKYEFLMSNETFKTAQDAISFNGIYTHANVRPDKFDLPTQLYADIIED